MRSFPLFLALLLASCASSGTATDLAGTRWVLASADVPEETRPPFGDVLTFGADGSAGVASCNQCGGPYRVEDGRLRFDELACTRMYCADRIDLGPILGDAGTWTYERDGDALTLRRTTSSGPAVLRFEAASE